MSRTRHHGNKQKRRQFGKDWWWMMNYPKWWDRLYHSKPRRRKDKAACHQVLADPDNGENSIFQLDHKPHKYYW